jgi:hypothetical protein
VLIVAGLIRDELLDREHCPRRSQLARPSKRSSDPGEELVSEVAQVRQVAPPLRKQGFGEGFHATHRAGLLVCCDPFDRRLRIPPIVISPSTPS